MASTPRRMTKRPAGSLSSDGDRSTVIDAKRLPRRFIVEVRTPYRTECECGREVCGTARKQIDIAPQIMQAVDEAVVGAFELPAGSYEALVVCGHAGTFLSGVLRKS